jgi:integrase
MNITASYPSTAELDEGAEGSGPHALIGEIGGPLLLRPPEAAGLLGLTTRQVYELADASAIPTATIAGQLRIPKHALVDWIRQQTVTPAPSKYNESVQQSGRRSVRVQKQRHGQGSLYRRSSDGLWCGAIRTEGFNKIVYAKTRNQAARKLRALAASRRADLLPPTLPLLGDFLAEWLEQSVKPRLRPLTYRCYGNCVRNHIKPALGQVRIDQLGPRDLQMLMDLKLSEGLSAKSVIHIHQVVRSALNQAMRWGLLARNVATLVVPPRNNPPTLQPFNPADAKRFLLSIREHRFRALFIVSLALGLRQGEVLGLQWRDIDFERNTLTVRHQQQRLEGTLQLVEPKTAKSRRTLAMPPLVVDALREHRSRQLDERSTAAAAWTDSGRVFTSKTGAPLDRSGVISAFHKALADAGLPRMRFHDLRHSCATLLLVQGVSPRVVMDVLGHTEIWMTMDLYSHVLPPLQRDAADRMEQLLGSS